eukprot:COSAG02_NODE_23763_length_709_cov_0.832787_2_plen_44_part_01
MFDMASSLRTQLMFGESRNHESQACVPDPRPLTQQLGTVRTTQH